MDTLVTISVLDTEETRLLKELAEVRAAKAVLKRVCGLPDPPHGPVGLGPDEPPVPSVSAEAPPGKPEPRPRTSESGGGKRGRKPDTGRPLRIAQFLAQHGPKRVGEMVAARVAVQSKIHEAIQANRTWFQKTGPNLMDPWELTEAGRAAVTAASISAS